MAEIQVIFPPKLNGSNVPPVVHQWTKLAKQGEIVHWHVVSQNPDVGKIRIAFDHATSTFFPCNGGPSHVIEQSLKDGAPPSSASPPSKSTMIWGRAPDCGEKHIRHKYTVTGLDGAGNPLTSLALDPEIVTTTPTGGG